LITELIIIEDIEKERSEALSNVLITTCSLA